MDEVDLDALLKEASEAMDDAEDFSQFLREKATVAIERFLVGSELSCLHFQHVAVSSLASCNSTNTLLSVRRITFPRCQFQ